MFSRLAVAAALAGAALPAIAADLGPPPVAPVLIEAPRFVFIDEVRFGALAHDPGHREQGSVDANVEILTSRLHGLQTGSIWADWFFSPRLHLGTTVNFDGKTSHVYGGFTWTIPLTDVFFLEAAFGGAVHTGERHDTDPKRSRMGCTVTFREWGGLGAALGPHWRLLVGVEHLSHAGLCGEYNDGLTNVGAKLGYKF